MNDTDEQYQKNLDGTTVLVHPELQIDPTGNQGKVGRIDFSDLNADEMYVAFDHEFALSLYAMDALLILKPHQQLQNDLQTPSLVRNINTLDRLVLKRVENLMVNGGHARDLLEIVKSNAAAIQVATISLRDDYKMVVNAVHAAKMDSAANSLLGQAVILSSKYLAYQKPKDGIVGNISLYDNKDNQFLVEFPGERFSLHQSSDLLVLKQPNELYTSILTVGRDLTKEDFKSVMRANMLQEQGGNELNILEALKMSEPALNFSTSSLEDKLKILIDNGLHQHQSYRGR